MILTLLRRRCAPAIALLLCAALTAGCSRERYRQKADADARQLIMQKAAGPNWQLEDFNVYPDPASRMFDPFSPDREPMPPDDPFSHQLMHLIDGKRGFPHWHQNGDTPYVQNPNWPAYLSVNENGAVPLDEARAVQLALLHSPDYQQEREDLFLSALDVSTERFRFDSMLFAGTGTDFTVAGPRAIGSAGAARSQLAVDTDASVRRFFTTGAEFVAGFANSLVWQFSGNDTHSTSTLIDFTFIQPLLRNAGRDKILERLTIAERGLLANVRQLEWFRKGFNLEITTGRGGQPGPQRRGGVFGSGLTGFVGTGGGFGGVRGGGTAAGGGGGGAGGLGGSTAGGYLGLLQTQQTLRNEETNIAQLRSSLDQLEAFRPSGRIDFFQVEQVRQQLYDNTSRFLANKQAYQDALDGFKRTLGLPPQLPIEIEGEILERFQLIDPAISPRQDRLALLQREVGQTIVPLLRGPGDDPAAWRARMRRGLLRLEELLEEVKQLQQIVAEDNLKRAEEDIRGMEEILPERKEQAQRLLRQAQRTLSDPTQPQLIQYVDEELFQTEYLEQLPEEIRTKLGELQQRLQGLAQRADALESEVESLLADLDSVPDEQLEMLAEQIRERLLQPVPALLTNLSTEFLQIALEQARARTERILLAPVDIQAPLALEVARDYRLDWMNARAALVDAWRLIEFNADDLEGVLNVVVSGDTVNSGDNPFRIGASTSRLRMGFEFDAPFTRLQERNMYREALIDYQRARRSYYQFEDNIAASLRAILRQIQLDKVNFELRRRALRVAVEQVRLARLELLRPPQAEGDQLGPTTAQNLINALNSLRNAQDAFLNVWVDYEIQRKLLDLSMGTMQLTEQGLWIDPGPIGLRYGYPVVSAEILSACSLDPGLLEAELEEIGPIQVESVAPGAPALGDPQPEEILPPAPVPTPLP